MKYCIPFLCLIIGCSDDKHEKKKNFVDEHCYSGQIRFVRKVPNVKETCKEAKIGRST
jgi:hypothetical protein